VCFTNAGTTCRGLLLSSWLAGLLYGERKIRRTHHLVGCPDGRAGRIDQSYGVGGRTKWHRRLCSATRAIVPVVMRMPRLARYKLTMSSICPHKSWASSRWRKLRIIVLSGAGARPSSMPRKRRSSAES